MSDKFDDLTKNLAQSVTRRGALRKFGLGLAGMALASLGVSQASADPKGFNCQCKKPDFGCSKSRDPQSCFTQCGIRCSQ